mmetsp:Transcript_39048/g.91704  ORF Transcript_39048/g.91704 Transcript_39048/m.91704 type:complete len:218 (+) Transcript_39048:629-1282(+)
MTPTRIGAGPRALTRTCSPPPPSGRPSASHVYRRNKPGCSATPLRAPSPTISQVAGCAVPAGQPSAGGKAVTLAAANESRRRRGVVAGDVCADTGRGQLRRPPLATWPEDVDAPASDGNRSRTRAREAACTTSIEPSARPMARCVPPGERVGSCASPWRLQIAHASRRVSSIASEKPVAIIAAEVKWEHAFNRPEGSGNTPSTRLQSAQGSGNTQTC